MISAIIPVYNEGDRIEYIINNLVEFFRADKFEYEIIIGDDGSEDNTFDLIKFMQKKHKRVSYVKSQLNIGRGNILDKGFKKAKGDIIFYADADIAVNFCKKYLNKFLEELKKFDIVIGSKRLPDSVVHTTKLRQFLSLSYNTIVRYVFNSKINCHQTGFKFFNRDVLYDLLPKVKNKAWSWDTEMLIKAQRKGFKIKEMPVEVRYGWSSKFRPFRDSIRMGKYLLILFFKQFSNKNI